MSAALSTRPIATVAHRIDVALSFRASRTPAIAPPAEATAIPSAAGQLTNPEKVKIPVAVVAITNESAFFQAFAMCKLIGRNDPSAPRISIPMPAPKYEP